MIGGGYDTGPGYYTGSGYIRGGTVRSDVRLKEDIILLSRLDNGIALYRFQYKGDDHTA